MLTTEVKVETEKGWSNMHPDGGVGKHIDGGRANAIDTYLDTALNYDRYLHIKHPDENNTICRNCDADIQVSEDVQYIRLKLEREEKDKRKEEYHRKIPINMVLDILG